MTRAPGRPLVPKVAAAVVALAAAGGALLWFRGRAAEDVPGVPETGPSEPPPTFPAPRTQTEWIEALVEMLSTGDTDDAMWARVRLIAGGEPARARLAELARSAIHTNFALAEHCFDVLLRDPRPEDVPLALEALSSRDAEVVRRAVLLLGTVRDAQVQAATQRIAATVGGPWPTPRYVLRALAAIGTDAALTELERIATSPEVLRGVADEALGRIGDVGGERARAILLRELAAAADEDRVIAASQGLVTMGDATPAPRLRALLGSGTKGAFGGGPGPAGGPALDPATALTLLSRLRDEAAFVELEARLRAPIETSERQVQALELLANFPFERRAPLLRHAAAPGMPRDVRVDAWKQLGRDGDAKDRAELLALLRSESSTAREDRFVAALAAPRVPDPRAAAALLAAEDANRGDAELRGMLLRAMVFSGAPEAAERVVRSMAADPSPHARPDAVAYEVSLVLKEAAPEFRAAARPWILRALQGELGPVAPAATAHLLVAAGYCCGAEAAPLVEPLLVHEDRHLREGAADFLGNSPGPTSLAALRSAWWRQQDPYSRGAIRRALRRAPLAHPVR